MIESFDQLSAGARSLRVQLQRGDIRLTANAEGRWTLEWRSEGDGVPEVERVGDVLSIRQRAGTLMRQRLDVRIGVPAELDSVELKTGWGRVEAEGVRSRLEVSSGNGPLSLRRTGGEADIATGNGEMTVEAHEGRLNASSGNGRIQVRGSRGDLRVNSGNGRAEVRDSDGRIRISTGNGDIVVVSTTGEAELNTGHGRVEVSDARSLALRASSAMGPVQVHGGSLREAKLNAMMGDVHCAAGFEPGRYELATGMGNLSVQIPAGTPARIDAQTGFGQVSSDFPLVRVGRSGPMGFGGVRMVGSISEGEATVDISLRAGKGQIAIRRAQQAAAVAAEPRGRWSLLRTPATSAGDKDPTLEVLERVARGELSPEEADELLRQRTGH